MYSQPKMNGGPQRVIANERGATMVEYVLAAAILAVGLVAVVGMVQQQVAQRVETGRGAYGCYEIADPSSPGNTCDP